MSLITYNGITLPYTNNTQLIQEAVYDDMGGTDFYLTKFDVTTSTIINSNYLAMLAPESTVGVVPDTTNPADIMKAIRSHLLQPRKTLSIKFNDVEIIPQSINTTGASPGSGGGTVDAKNGPQPKSCNLTQLTNNTFLMTFHIVAHYWDCPVVDSESGLVTGNNPGSPVLYNRWTETVDLDYCQVSRRTRTGKFVIRSDNDKGFIADQVRTQFAVVGIPKGFTRESSRYTVSADGLSVQYVIVDKEEFKMPPKPAFRATGTYIESSSIGTTPKVGGELDLTLESDNVTPQDVLVKLAVQIAIQKAYASTKGFKSGFISSFRVQVDMYKNLVRVHASIWKKPSTTIDGKGTAFGLWGPDYAALTFTPLSDDVAKSANQPPYTARGTTPLLLQAAAYYDPCLATSILAAGVGQMNTGLAPGQAGAYPE